MRSVSHEMFQPPARSLHMDAHTTWYRPHAGEMVRSRRLYTDITRAAETRDGKGRMTQAERISWKKNVYNESNQKDSQRDGRDSYDREELFMPDGDAQARATRRRR